MKPSFEEARSHFNQTGHILVIRDKKTNEVIDSMILTWTPMDTVLVGYKGNVKVESKTMKDIISSTPNMATKPAKKAKAIAKAKKVVKKVSRKVSTKK